MFPEEAFRVIVEVVELQGLVWPAPSSGVKPKLPNPFVEVIVGNESQWTSTRETTSTCSFNRLFLFSNIWAEESLEVRVYHKALLGRELIGTYSTSIAAIRNAVDHRVIQTLYPLIIRERPSEPRGFVRLSVHVLKAGEVVKTDGAGAGAQRPRILYTPELDFDSYYLTLNVYFGQDLLKTVDPPHVGPPSPRIQIEFTDFVLSTQTVQTTREPTWSESLRFPATVPCSADKITVELWVDAVQDHRISYATLSFDKILKTTRAPAWLNFYTDVAPTARRRGRRESPSALAAFTALFELEDEEEEAPVLTGFHYYGRILVSASCTKHKAPGPPQTFPCRSVPPPPHQEMLLWADLFELSGVVNQTDIVTQLAFGDWVASLKPSTQWVDTVGFTGDEGRVPEEKFFLPVDLESSYDLIVRVYGRAPTAPSSRASSGSTPRLLAYARLAPSTLLRREERAAWIDLIPADKVTDAIETRATRGGGISVKRTLSLLASMVLRRPESVQEKPRCSKSTFSVLRYNCSLCCYQAVYLPVLRSCLPSPHVVISLGGGSATTQTLFHTIHPDWHEILSFSCTLPEDLTLARDLLIQTFANLNFVYPPIMILLLLNSTFPQLLKRKHKNDAKPQLTLNFNAVFSRDAIIGEAKIPARYLMSEEGRHPQWYPLTSRRFPASDARILCSFHLALSDNGTPALTKTALPKQLPSFTVDYEPYDLRLLVLGCRLFSSVYGGMGDLTIAPEIQVEFGRQPYDLNSRLWYGTCDRVVRGSDGNFDYFCPLEVKCFLPRSEMFQTFLEFRLFQPHNEGSRELGTSYLYLTPLIPRFSPRLKQLLQAEFGFVPAALSEMTPPQLTVGSLRRRFLAPIATASQKERRLGSPYTTDFDLLQVALMDEEQMSTAESAGETLSSDTDVDALVDKSPAEALNVYTSDVDVFFARESSQLRTLMKDSKYMDALSNFLWSSSPPTADTTVEELHRPLESELQVDELPYLVLPIIGPGRNSAVAGSPDIVGVLKVRCKVFSAGQDKTQENMAVDKLHLKFSDAPRMKARIHVLSASGLLPSLTSKQPGGQTLEGGEWFLTLANANAPSGTTASAGIHEIKDTKFTGKGPSPDFYRSFELDVQFPENSLLTVGVASVGSLWAPSYFVGRTVVDLENRYAHPNFLALTADETGPTLIETRTLRNVTNEEPTGSVRMWLQLLTEEEASKKPLVPVSLEPPEVVQVRVVVWQLKGVPCESYGSVSLYMVGMMSGTTPETIVSQETDTHWNSTDGRGVFNWRFVFNVTVPSEASQLRLQLWGRNLLATHESIAETVVDLSSDLLKCKSMKDNVLLDRAWVKLFHPANPTQLMGLLDTEISLLPEQNALDNPVGLGREKPNRDPFLPDVTENRNYITTSALGQTVFGASDKVLYGAKICSWLITLVVIITLYSIFSKLFS